MTVPRWHRPTEDLGARAATAFARHHGGDPDGVWAAPGRVNLIGEHVDYNAGRCLPLALRHRTACAARRRADGVLHVATDGRRPWTGALEDLRPGNMPGWVRYVAGAVWALRRTGADVGGIDLTIESEVPIGAGLSSSAALICAVAVAVADLSGWADAGDPDAVARLTPACVRAETQFVGAPTGGMDQAAALRTQAAHALLLDCRDDSVEQLPLDLARNGLALLVVDTGVSHRNVDGRYGDRRRGCERAARLLGVATLRDVADSIGSGDDALGNLVEALRPLEGDDTHPLARHVLTEMRRVDDAAAALARGDLASIGPLLDASHASLRDDFAVSCTELDLAVDAARDIGALGARMTGGGFGGSAIALVGATDVDRVATAVDRTFLSGGHRQPSFLLAEPSGPASRLA